MKKQILKIIYVVTFMAAFVLFGAVSLFYKNDTIGIERFEIKNEIIEVFASHIKRSSCRG